MLPRKSCETVFQIAVVASLCLSLQGMAFAQTSKKQPPAPAPAAATAENQTAKPAPYDQQLARLSEILGALQYIEGLCKSASPNDWRTDMTALLAAEAANEPARLEKFTAAFNRGYRAFAAVYTACTQNAKLAENAYRHEGATLSQEMTSRFGN